MKYPSLFALLLVSALMACNSEVRQNRLKRIEALEHQLGEADAHLQTVDTAMAQKRLKEINAINEWVFEHQRDTLHKRVGLPLSDILRSKKYFERSIIQSKVAFGAVNTCRTQLSALRRDVENDFYTDDEFIGYYDTEAKAVAVAITEAGNLRRDMPRQRNTLTRISPL
jgi:hypothetical protein